MMERVYDNDVDKEVRFFVGNEIEHTPAHGMRTLFVVGVQPVTEIHSWAVAHGCQHIYFGANMSFDVSGTNDAEGWGRWEDMIKLMLKSENAQGQSYWCTLDIDLKHSEGLHESGLCEHNRFIPMISVKLPYTGLFNYNTTIKIDDKTFDATNPGVWCWSLHDLMDRKRFTDWSKYKEDKVI
jgi:hypothetical protein